MKTTKAQRDEWRENGFDGRPFPYVMLPLMDDADLADEAVAALRLFVNASMSRSESGGETFIGWQRGEGLDAHERVKQARAIIAKADAFAAEFQKEKG
jgi:hypothetical protein